MTSAITVALGERSYDIHVGSGLLSRAGHILRPLLAAPKVFVVTDENIEGLHLEALKESLDDAGLDNHGVVLPAGEQTKSFPHLESLLDAMLEARCERGTTIIAFGGGVIGDLTGFAASVLLRGVPFVQIPTTLLSQVDSSVGGKTGINTRQGKNLVGSFYQPRAVLADIDVLSTLPPRELKAGYAEVVKYGLIDDPAFFDWLETRGVAVVAADAQAGRQAVLTSCRAKARIVAADERESGQRALLNLGHTFAHALEAEGGYGELLLHGEAVSIGMVLAFDLSVAMGLCPAADRDRLVRHLHTVGLPVCLPPLPGGEWSVERLLAHFGKDKKVKDGRVTFVLARGIGQAFLSPDVPAATLKNVLDAAIGRAGVARS
ncbi:3-dehydroquinate synthase [Telmatospirillum siberiense]|uniref:3-dehydroquinate synthase n=1 Tax=Telmatospirillum siberiense TaxID=382514 RepID=A0A2N3PQW2_9PROT|nr:3-dehydroquinate synthase [Telmatospirillum siberiense]PKU22774.1 3-dehydroquinate synthase [Telmatospirillum siberiense]